MKFPTSDLEAAAVDAIDPSTIHPATDENGTLKLVGGKPVYPVRGVTVPRRNRAVGEFDPARVRCSDGTDPGDEHPAVRGLPHRPVDRKGELTVLGDRGSSGDQSKRRRIVRRRKMTELMVAIPWWGWIGHCRRSRRVAGRCGVHSMGGHPPRRPAVPCAGARITRLCAFPTTRPRLSICMCGRGASRCMCSRVDGPTPRPPHSPAMSPTVGTGKSAP